MAKNKDFRHNDISVITTLYRTIFLVVMTFIFLLSVRFLYYPKILMDKIIKLNIWRILSDFLNLQTALSREQLLLIVIVVMCFSLALFIQLLALIILKKLKKLKKCDKI